MDKLTHINEDGYAKMVNVSGKNETSRFAKAVGEIHMKSDTIKLITENAIKKGDVLAVAQVAGIMATKNTANLIPMCHSINLEGADIKFKIYDTFIKCYCEVTCSYKTGVEMEAILGVSVALTTIYDMCKAVDKMMKISNIYLIEKKGGKSGHFLIEEIENN
ncbi:MAG: cyclic pyranopterin monophosphate synthase MoaC [Lachnospirales bacterium]